MRLQRNQPRKRPANHSSNANQAALPTFLEHIAELRRRIFWIVGCVLLASTLAFPFQQQIIHAITLPLGGQQLFYLTPMGGIGFVIKVCMYTGVAVTVPLLIYHLYRYLEPLMGDGRRRVVGYTFASIGLALTGMAFAYFISLPSALHFLTGFQVDNVQAMVTVDSYLSFVMTYMIGAALLFQLPLILLIVNSITPLPPRKLLGALRFVIVGAVIVGAIISPTPDVMNQVIIAVPIVIMYVIGVIMVWAANRHRVKAMGPVQEPSVERKGDPGEERVNELLNSWDGLDVRPKGLPVAQVAAAAPPAVSKPGPAVVASPKRVSLDGMVARPTKKAVVARPVRLAVAAPPARSAVYVPSRVPAGGSLDGVVSVRERLAAPAS